MENAPRDTDLRGGPAAPARRPRRLRVALEASYVLAVTTVAALGFATGSTATILGAVVLALPVGLPALVGYYMIYGLLGQVPGANPDVSSGSASCTPGAGCQVSETGDLAPWFAHTMDIVGVLAVAVAAVANVVLLRFAAAKFHASKR
jgi:hypothetical protein